MRIGEKHITNQGYSITIIDYNRHDNYTIEFSDGTILYNKYYSDIKSGEIKHRLHPTVCETGYLGYGKYKAHDNNKPTKSYTIWHSMILRCYSKKYNKKHKSYQTKHVCDNWLCFQNFAKWFEQNYIEGFELDKDILVKGNGIYSPETCCFVPSEINKMFVKTFGAKRPLLLGVGIDKKKFSARMSNYTIGNFNTPEEAFQAYKTTKEQKIKDVANKWRDKITESIYNALINYKIEIDD